METCADDKLRIIIYPSVMRTENARAPFLRTPARTLTAPFPTPQQQALTWQGSIKNLILDKVALKESHVIQVGPPQTAIFKPWQ